MGKRRPVHQAQRLKPFHYEVPVPHVEPGLRFRVDDNVWEVVAGSRYGTLVDILALSGPLKGKALRVQLHPRTA